MLCHGLPWMAPPTIAYPACHCMSKCSCSFTTRLLHSAKAAAVHGLTWLYHDPLQPYSASYDAVFVFRPGVGNMSECLVRVCLW